MQLEPLLLSIEIATIATALSAAIGVGVAALLSARAFRGRDALDVLVTAPMVMPPTVLGYYVLVVLGRRSPIGVAFEALTGGTLVFSRAGAVVAAGIGAFPLVAKSARAAFESVDPVFVRAARTLGASSLRAFFTVTVPLARRGLFAGLMLGFARSMGDFGLTLMVAGDIPGETRTASLAIYDAIQENRQDEALLLSVVLTAAALGILYAAGKLASASDAG